MQPASQMPLESALDVLAGVRGDRVIVTTMATTRPWIRMGHHPLDFNYIPSTMGGGIPLALGIALAQPRREVIVLSGIVGIVAGRQYVKEGLIAAVGIHFWTDVVWHILWPAVRSG